MIILFNILTSHALHSFPAFFPITCLINTTHLRHRRASYIVIIYDVSLLMYIWFLFPAAGAKVRSVPDSPAVLAGQESLGQDSSEMQARHYKTLSKMYNKPNAKPNQSNVAQMLDLEFQARRAFIDSDATREEDRATRIFEAYPCFKDTRNVRFLTFSLEHVCLFLCMLCYIKSAQW